MKVTIVRPRRRRHRPRLHRWKTKRKNRHPYEKNFWEFVKSLRSYFSLLQICQNSHPIEHPSAMTTCQSQATSYHVNSAATTILDDQSSSVVMMPIKSGEKSSSDTPNDFNALIDEQLQKTLENQLRNHLISCEETDRNRSKQNKAKLTRSETGKLIDRLDLSETNFDVEFYEKQVRETKQKRFFSFGRFKSFDSIDRSFVFFFSVNSR